jgi:exodeoxyribonuclease V gamma subunit
LLALYEAQGALPHGAMATQAYGQVEAGAANLLERLAPYQGLTSTPLSIALSCEVAPGATEVILSGQITTYRVGLGLLHYSPSKLKPKHQLALWVEHLALCAAGILEAGQQSVLIAKDAERTFQVLEPAAAMGLLNEYVALYREGLSRPLPLFPSASFEVALESDEEALKKARKLWAGSEWDRSTPDSRDVYIALAHRGCSEDPIEVEEHLQLAQAVYGPLRRMGEGE